MSDSYGTFPFAIVDDERYDDVSDHVRTFGKVLAGMTDDWGLFEGGVAAFATANRYDKSYVREMFSELTRIGVVTFYKAEGRARDVGLYIRLLDYPGHTIRKAYESQRGPSAYPLPDGSFIPGRDKRKTDQSWITVLNQNLQAICKQAASNLLTVEYKGNSPFPSGKEPTEKRQQPRTRTGRYKQRASKLQVVSNQNASVPAAEKNAAKAAFRAPDGAGSTAPTAGALGAPPRGSRPENTNPNPAKVRKLSAEAVEALSPEQRRAYKAARRAQRDDRRPQVQPVAIVAPPEPVQPPKPPEPTPEERAAEQARIVAEREERAKAAAERREAERVKAEADEAKRKADMAERADMIARARVSFAKMAAEDDASKLPWPSEALEARCAAMIASFARLGAQKPSVVSRTIGDLMAKAGLEVATRALDRLDAMGQAWEGWRKQDPWDPVTKLLADAAKPALAPVPDP